MSVNGPVGAWTSVLGAAPVRDVLQRCELLTGVHPVVEVGSTQDLAATLVSAGSPGGTVVLADRQLAGRGRVGRSWDDRPDGGTLALTVLLDIGAQVPEGDPLRLVPHALGLGVLRGCERSMPGVRGLALKWPNDLVHRVAAAAPPRKVAGVLVERERIASSGRPRDVVLCGVGVNVDLGGAEGEDRTCLRALAGTAPDRGDLLATLLGALDEALLLAVRDPRGLVAAYRSVSDTIGRRVRVEQAGGTLSVGVATDVDTTGQLLLDTPDGSRAVLSGTVRDAEDAREATR